MATLCLDESVEGVVAEVLISTGIERVGDAGDVVVRVEVEPEVLDYAGRLGREPVVPIEGAGERDPVAVGQRRHRSERPVVDVPGERLGNTVQGRGRRGNAPQ
ncbi:MAG: hypothetical protein ACREXW_14260 [Gammaproteobacteria bacterium]